MNSLRKGAGGTEVSSTLHSASRSCFQQDVGSWMVGLWGLMFFLGHAFENSRKGRFKGSALSLELFERTSLVLKFATICNVEKP